MINGVNGFRRVKGEKMVLRRGKVSGMLLTVLILMLLSCEESGGAAVKDAAVSVSELQGAVVEAPQSVETARRATMIRGNYWVRGVPGFSVNNFSALTGEYRLPAADAGSVSPRAAGEAGSGGEGDFSVYLTIEPLYFSEEWRPWGGIERALQYSSEDGFFAAVTADDSRGSFWVAVFRFPLGFEKAGLSTDTLNHLLLAWTNRFSYFLSLSKTIEHASLPAVVDF